jgi:hypothetical protein
MLTCIRLGQCHGIKTAEVDYQNVYCRCTLPYLSWIISEKEAEQGARSLPKYLQSPPLSLSRTNHLQDHLITPYPLSTFSYPVSWLSSEWNHSLDMCWWSDSPSYQHRDSATGGKQNILDKRQAKDQKRDSDRGGTMWNGEDEKVAAGGHKQMYGCPSGLVHQKVHWETTSAVHSTGVPWQSEQKRWWRQGWAVDNQNLWYQTFCIYGDWEGRLKDLSNLTLDRRGPEMFLSQDRASTTLH